MWYFHQNNKEYLPEKYIILWYFSSYSRADGDPSGAVAVPSEFVYKSYIYIFLIYIWYINKTFLLNKSTRISHSSVKIRFRNRSNLIHSKYVSNMYEGVWYSSSVRILDEIRCFCLPCYVRCYIHCFYIIIRCYVRSKEMSLYTHDWAGV